MDTRFRLEVNLSIVREERPEGGDSAYWRSTPDRLNVSESLDLGSRDFMGVMGVLGKLHQALTDMKETGGS